jgi:hypothetical protein
MARGASIPVPGGHLASPCRYYKRLDRPKYILSKRQTLEIHEQTQGCFRLPIGHVASSIAITTKIKLLHSHSCYLDVDPSYLHMVFEFTIKN